ncbi:MAG: nuclear transport factor 2 family protein [Candidatus Thorarchaeota archaeon]
MSAEDNESEKKAIEKAIMDYYHEGHVHSDPILYEGVLHPDWKFFMQNDEGQLEIVDRDEYKSWYNPDEVDKRLKWETKFFYIDVTGKAASAKISIENQNVRYVDYFNLISQDGRWWIVNKISHPFHK